MIYSHKKTKIVFSKNIFKDIRGLANLSFSKMFVLTDCNTAQKCLPLIKNELGADNIFFTISLGENNKNIDKITEIWNLLNKNGADRKSILVNLGGGVVCDMGGFAASTFKRGVRFINIPTTLLSQVDASVGGKTGINFNGCKNEIGTFAFPERVIIHTGFLETLPKEHILSGFGEMIKHALIYSKAYYSDLQNINIEKNYSNDLMLELIKRSVSIKKEIVTADPTEQSIRKTLNFGHTVGHALESYFLNSEKELLHGQAVAYGMIVELYLSALKLNFQRYKLEQIKNYINSLYGKFIFEKKDFENIYELITHDKKNENSYINCTLLEDIGQAQINQKITKDEIFSAFYLYLV